MKARGQYTLDDFFRVTTEIKVPGKTLIVRTLSDAEMQARQHYALEANRKAQKLYSNHDCEEYLALLEPLKIFNDDELVTLVLSLKTREFDQERRRRLDLPVIITPDDASDAERIQTMEARENALKEYEEKIAKGVTSDIEAFKKYLEGKSHDELFAAAAEEYVKSEVQNSFFKAFECAWIYYATFYKNHRFFRSPEDTAKLDVRIKDILFAACQDVYGVDIWDMQNFFETETSTPA